MRVARCVGESSRRCPANVRCCALHSTLTLLGVHHSHTALCVEEERNQGSPWPRGVVGEPCEADELCEADEPCIHRFGHAEKFFVVGARSAYTHGTLVQAGLVVESQAIARYLHARCVMQQV
jgi:hypothetical protein